MYERRVKGQWDTPFVLLQLAEKAIYSQESGCSNDILPFCHMGVPQHKFIQPAKRCIRTNASLYNQQHRRTATTSWKKPEA
ncbi:hypothetical protein [Segetibacter sp.]|uniref:hypothetical protein n=1 Tax=Segetibacter sp. TaxID=2231182 RepID=UPI002633AFC6|nr:hypothetical protein [Segetibacter sp.]